jgi:3-hydroxyacyl-[acyl-carrier-protein] dehydratase
MLKDDFFSIIIHSITDTRQAEFTIALNPEHTIYKAHFPGNPITPGVCILQMAIELFSFLQQTDFKVKKIKTAKFIHPILPTIHPVLHYQIGWEEVIEDNSSYVKIQVYQDDIIFSKINMYMEKKRTE